MAAGSLHLANDAARLRIDALAPGLLRVRLAHLNADPEDASWVVAADIRAARDIAACTEDGQDEAVLRTTLLTARVSRDNLAIRIEDNAGRLLLADAPSGGHALKKSGFALRKTMAKGERFLALGDKTGPTLDRRGRRFVNWTTDKDTFPDEDPIYKAIPFVVGANGPAGCWGLFVDCTWKTVFDFGAAEPDVLRVEADGGTPDLYVLAGPTLADVVRRYADLTGHAPLPPLWAFGYQQCRWSYRSADELRGIAKRLRHEDIPADVLWLDIDFQDRSRPFTTDPEAFPDLPGLVAEMRDMGFATIVITDLHIAAAPGEGYAPYDTGMAAGAFLTNPDGAPFTGPVWPGPAHFPDFTSTSARAWWGGLYRDFVEAGVAGFWNDMNEPSVFDAPGKTIPLDVAGRIEEPGFAPRAITQAEGHNLVGLLNARATFEGVARLAPDARPFVMTRATFAGGQRWAVTWTGDNFSEWEQIDLGVRQIVNLGLSGFAFTAVDIGGFSGTPTPDLLTRWFQVGAFLPMMRDHTAKDTPQQEPWVHGPAHLAIRKRFVEERYRLLPTLYALAEEAHRTGLPMVRPAFFEDGALLDAPQDFATTFMLGPHILVAIPPPPGAGDYRVALPQGLWFDWWDDAPVAAQPASGGAFQVLHEGPPDIERLPVFVRAGAIVARQSLVQTTAVAPEGPLGLHVWLGAEGSATLYDDDGLTIAHADGRFRRQTVRLVCRGTGATRLEFDAPEGDVAPVWSELAVEVHGWAAPTLRVLFDDESVSATLDPARRRAGFILPVPGKATVTLEP